MEENDRRLAESKSYLKLLVDSSAFIAFQAIAKATGTHPLNLIEDNPEIDYFFSNAVANEFIKGKDHISNDVFSMLKKSLVDEAVSLDDTQKDSRHLYNAKDGSIKWTTLTSISGVDSGQILLCQNHKDLVLLTNDHKMIKNAGALLDRRLLDVKTLLEIMADVPDKTYQKEWKRLREWYDKNYGYIPPKSVRFIVDRQPGELPPHLAE